MGYVREFLNWFNAQPNGTPGDCAPPSSGISSADSGLAHSPSCPRMEFSEALAPTDGARGMAVRQMGSA